jgi:hypothetical protein
MYFGGSILMTAGTAAAIFRYRHLVNTISSLFSGQYLDQKPTGANIVEGPDPGSAINIPDNISKN